MADIKIPMLVSKKSKTAGTSWHWQPSATLRKAGWPSKALGKDMAQAMAAAMAINEQVQQWKEHRTLPDGIAKRRAAGTLDALIERYKTEYLHAPRPNGKKLSPSTIDNYNVRMKRLSHWAGDQPLAYITTPTVHVLRDAMLRPKDDGGIGHASCHGTLQMLRQLFSFAEAKGLIGRGQNPAEKFNLGAPASRRTVWTQEHDSAFDTSARHLGYPSMALARTIAEYTAQRQSDVIGFTEHQYQPIELYDQRLLDHFGDASGKVMGWRLTQNKTGMPLEMSFPPHLREQIEKAFRTNRARDRAAGRITTYLIINDQTGQPWNRRQFHKCYRDILRHAAKSTGLHDMTDLTWHDLRRTRVVRMRAKGQSKESIAAVTGTNLSSIEKMLATYGPINATMTANALADAATPTRNTPKHQIEEALDSHKKTG